jgi:hypothetical protein
MSDAMPTETRGEHYVVEIDGVPKFQFQIFSQALSAALLLRSDFPRCTVKLRGGNEGCAPKQ